MTSTARLAREAITALEDALAELDTALAIAHGDIVLADPKEPTIQLHPNIGGDPLPPHGDTAGEQACRTGNPRAFRDLRLHTLEAHRHALALRSLVQKITPHRAPVDLVAGIEVDPVTEEPIGAPGCTSCNRIGRWMPVAYSGRCRWCYDWWLAEKADPPVAILEAHHDGKRITTAMVQAARQPNAKRIKRKHTAAARRGGGPRR